MQKDYMRRAGRLLLLAPLLLLPARWAHADVQRFRLNPDASQITAIIDDPFGNRIQGILRLAGGEARGDPDRVAETAAVDLVIDASSYNSNLGLRDQDVQEYYLEVKQYPFIRFASTAIVKSERPRSIAEPWLITVKGYLDFHGVKKEVLVPIQVFYQTGHIVAQGQFSLLLEEFKIAVPRLLFLKAGNKVQVEFRIRGERQP